MPTELKKSRNKPSPSKPESKKPSVATVALAFACKAALKAIEFILTRGLTVRMQLRKSDEGRRQLWTDVRLNGLSVEVDEEEEEFESDEDVHVEVTEESDEE